MKPLSPAAGERRRFWRASFAAPAQLTLSGVACQAELLDISLKGALLNLAADTAVAAGQPCELRLPLDEGGDAAIAMQATVTHVEAAAHRVGLRCDAIDVDSITHLRRLVELNAGDAALLERELAALIGE